MGNHPLSSNRINKGEGGEGRRRRGKKEKGEGGEGGRRGRGGGRGREKGGRNTRYDTMVVEKFRGLRPPAPPT